jgi:glycosyltransferase involved in cell wall biosynthesis
MDTTRVDPDAAGAPIGYHARDLGALFPGVTVFVASFNTRNALELTLRSAKRLAGCPFDFHVGDSGSTDGSRDLIARLQQDGVISVREVAQGRRHWEWLDHWRQTCPTRYAVFVDSDVQFLRPGWLAAVLETADRKAWALVGGEMVPEQPDSLHDGVVPFRFAARLSPWLLLVDIAECDPVPISFQDWSHESTRVHEGRVAYDVSGTLFHTLRLREIGCGPMPTTFQRSYRHYGGLSWQARGMGRLWLERRFRDLALVSRLQVERRRRND